MLIRSTTEVHRKGPALLQLGCLRRLTRFGKALTLIFAMSGASASLAASSQGLFQKSPDGLVRPFKLKQVPLEEFVRQYSALTETPIVWDVDTTGSVTLLAPRPLSVAALTELFHETLGSWGYSVVDGPGKSGWLILRTRDARDGVLPLYDLSQVPATHRLVTAVATLQSMHAEPAARTMRSFMPANSRIIPVSESKLLITDTGANIRKVATLLQLIDVKGEIADNEALTASYSNDKCPGDERHIEKLVIENLELPGQSGLGDALRNSSVTAPPPNQNKRQSPEKTGGVR